MQENDVMYQVVVNQEEQYSIWPLQRSVPAGWSEAGHQGSKADCLRHIDAVWKDITPKSARAAKTAMRTVPIKAVKADAAGQIGA